MTFLFGVKDCVTSGSDGASIVCVLFFVGGFGFESLFFLVVCQKYVYSSS